MTVPKYKRKDAACEYINQARIVLKETTNLMRKWPKSRQRIEADNVMDIAYEMFKEACKAYSIYAVYPFENEMKLRGLENAHGLLNALSSLSSDWLDNPPQTKSKKSYNRYPAESKKEAEARQIYFETGEEVPDQFKYKRYVVTPERLEKYAGTLYRAIGVFSGAIKAQRKFYSQSRETYSKNNPCVNTPSCSVPNKASDIPSTAAQPTSTTQEAQTKEKLSDLLKKHSPNSKQSPS